MERRCFNIIINTHIESRNPEVYAKEVVVHELSSKPTDFWKRWTKTAKVMRLQVAFWSSFGKVRRFI